jgi:hypothetical protein
VKITEIIRVKCPQSEMERVRLELEQSGYIVEPEEQQGCVVLVIKKGAK